MNLVWKHLLPALKEKPLEENKQTLTALQNKLSSLSHSVVMGKPTSKQAALISKQTYSLPSNNEGITAIGFDLTSKNPTITFSLHEKPFTIPIGIGKIQNGSYPMPTGESTPVATSGGWISPDTLQVRVWLYETPFSFTYDITFNKNEVKIGRKSNVNIGPATNLEMIGTKKAEARQKVVTK
jgi:hypothetical protein